MSDSLLEESIHVALENKVRTLDLFLCNYVLGEIVYRGESIVEVNLGECELRTLSVEQFMCPNLTKLNL